MTEESRLRYSEDIEVGKTHDLGSYHLTGASIVEFSRHWDPLTIHTDPYAAATNYFKGLIASGVHSLAIYQRLATIGLFSTWAIVAGRSIEQARFLAPVYADMDLTGNLTVESIDDTKRPVWSLITTHWDLVDSALKRLVTIRTTSYVRQRPRAKARGEFQRKIR